MMAWLCDMRSTWLWWPKCNQVWAWLESGLAYPSIERMSMAKRSFHSMAQYLGFVKAPEKDGRDYSVVFEVGFKIKWFISSSPDCKKKNQMLDLLATKAVKPQRLVDLRGCLFCRQHGWNDSICIQELTMEIGITSRIPTLCRIWAILSCFMEQQMISLQISFEQTGFWNDRVESFGKMQGF